MRGNTSPEEATLILDSSATSHTIEESVARELDADVANGGEASNIQLGENGKVL